VAKNYNFGQKKAVSLQDAAQLIVLFHPRIFQAKGNENTEEEMIAIAEAAYYPQISGGLAAQRENERSNRYDKKYIQDMSVSINQVLYDFGKISSAVKSAKYGHLGAQIQTKLTNEELIHISSLAVITANRSKELGLLAKSQVKSVDSLSQLVEERHAKGASNLSDVYQAKSRLNDVLSEELDVHSQHQSIIKSLGVMIGQKQITEATVGVLPSGLEMACFATPTWHTIPEYELAQIEAERAVTELERAKAEELPTISLTGNASRPLNATPRYGSRVDTKVGINVSIPVYQGGALSAGKKVAESRIESADARRMEVQLDIEQKLSEAQVHLQNLTQRSNLLNQRVDNLKNTKELYKQQYLELGTRTLVDLLNSEQEYHRAQVDVVNNRFDIIQTQLECAYRQGK
ncbi:TolC family protein, partial [Wohlfahrtiimonas larvae]|uniref:TolC family protein n=1 Tax=Wohlfahrtiimonas larvae TaxID=1157986 RepID=UPI0031E762B2